MTYSFFELKKYFRDLPSCSLIEDLGLMDEDTKKEAEFEVDPVPKDCLKMIDATDSWGADWKEEIEEAISKGFKVYRVTDKWNQWTYGFVRAKKTKKRVRKSNE